MNNLGSLLKAEFRLQGSRIKFREIKRPLIFLNPEGKRRSPQRNQTRPEALRSDSEHSDTSCPTPTNSEEIDRLEKEIELFRL